MSLDTIDMNLLQMTMIEKVTGKRKASRRKKSRLWNIRDRTGIATKMARKTPFFFLPSLSEKKCENIPILILKDFDLYSKSGKVFSRLIFISMQIINFKRNIDIPAVIYLCSIS